MARTHQLAALGITIALALSSGSNVSLSNVRAQDELGAKLDGKKLFDKETFGGNGRTCLTCHSKETGTFGLSDVQRIIDKADPDDAFLIHDALDDDGIGTTRIQTHGTIRVTIPLPPWLSLDDDPGATEVSVFRVLCGAVQDPHALGSCGHCALFPRQRREDVAGCCCSLSAVLQLHGRAGPGRLGISGWSHHADRRRC